MDFKCSCSVSSDGQLRYTCPNHVDQPHDQSGGDTFKLPCEHEAWIEDFDPKLDYSVSCVHGTWDFKPRPSKDKDE